MLARHGYPGTIPSPPPLEHLLRLTGSLENYRPVDPSQGLRRWRHSSLPITRDGIVLGGDCMQGSEKVQLLRYTYRYHAMQASVSGGGAEMRMPLYR